MTTTDPWRALRRRFADRLATATLDLAFDYVRHGEEPLALETLCDRLLEADVALVPEDVEVLMQVNAGLRPRLPAPLVAALKARAGWR